MKVTCPISGLEYEVSFPHFGTSRAPHPMLQVSATKLNSTYLELHTAQQLSSELTHLLALAYLVKLPLVELPALPTSAHQTFHAFWITHMERLASLATKLEAKVFMKKLPTIRVTQDNLSNLKHWIEDLEGILASASTPIDSARVRKLNSAFVKAEREAEVATNTLTLYTPDEIQELIMRGLKGSQLTKKEAKAFPTLMADWTAEVANFPATKLTLPSGKKVTLRSYWHSLVEAAFSTTGVLDLLCEDTNTADIEELLEHCYENVSYDYSVHASTLWRKLEELRDSLTSYKINPPGKIKAPKLPKLPASSADILAMLGEVEEVETQVETMAPKGPEGTILSEVSQSSKSSKSSAPDISILLGETPEPTPTTSTTSASASALTLQQKLALKLQNAKRN